MSAQSIPVLELKNVTKSYGGNVAVDNVSFVLPQSSIYAVIGPNGAGKSTLFSTIAGQHAVDSGTIALAGKDITSQGARRRARGGISRAFQVAHIFTSKTVEENVRLALLAGSLRTHVFWARASRVQPASGVDDLLAQVQLTDVAHREAGELSQGDRKKLEIALGLATSPTLLLLDEPTAGMTPDETSNVMDLVASVQAATRCSVLITEHDMKVVFGLAEQVIVLANGALLCQGTPEEIRNSADVKAVYLGGR